MAVAALERALATDPSPTGVAAYNDEIAMEVLAAFHRLGLSVSDQVAVIGVDNLPFGQYPVPALTTLWQHLGQDTLDDTALGWLLGEVDDADAWTDFHGWDARMVVIVRESA